MFLGTDSHLFSAVVKKSNDLKVEACLYIELNIWNCSLVQCFRCWTRIWEIQVKIPILL